LTERSALVALAVVLLACAPAYAQKYEGLPIKSIEIVGNHLVSDEFIKSQIALTPGDVHTKRARQNVILKLSQLGRFADIVVDAEKTDDNQVVLTFIVRERRVIDEIKFVGNKKLNDRDLKEALTLRVADTYLPQSFDNEQQKIADLYAQRGYSNAQVDVEIHEVAPSRVCVVYRIAEGGKARIRKVSFEGNTAFTDRELRKMTKTRKAFLFLGGKFDETKFQADLGRILAEYGDKGHIDARVVGTDLDYSTKPGKLLITVRLDEGSQYSVGSLALEGNKVFDDDELLDLITVHDGDIYNKGDVHGDLARGKRGDIHRIATFYFDAGYITCEVTPQVTLDTKQHLAHVTHKIDEKKLVYVGEIDISGNVITQDKVIRRELTIFPGDRYDGEKIRRSVRKVRNLRYFEDEIEISREFTTEDSADLFLRVTEGDTGAFNFGGGFSSDEGVLGFLELELRNFDIANFPRFSGAGQTAGLRLQYGETRRELGLSFTEPYMFGYPVSFGFDLFTRDLDYQTGSDYAEDRTGLRLRFGKSLSEYTRGSLMLRLEDVDITDVADDAPSELKAEEGARSTISATLELTRDTRDYIMDPTTGSRHRISLELAGGPFFGDTDFVKLMQDSVWYYPLTNNGKLVVSLHETWGIVEEYGDSDGVPIFERFFVGGSSTVRGYDYRDIGPRADDRVYTTVPLALIHPRLLFDRDEYGSPLRWLVRAGWPVPVPTGERDDTPIGGKVRIVGNVELGYALSQYFKGYLFADGGTAWAEIDDVTDLDDLRFSVGLGVGVRTPIGPIRVDYGFPINPDEYQGNGRLHFTTGFRF
jgi:outer membrane protein insertion porin family